MATIIKRVLVKANSTEEVTETIASRTSKINVTAVAGINSSGTTAADASEVPATNISTDKVGLCKDGIDLAKNSNVATCSRLGITPYDKYKLDLSAYHYTVQNNFNKDFIISSKYNVWGCHPYTTAFNYDNNNLPFADISSCPVSTVATSIYTYTYTNTTRAFDYSVITKAFEKDYEVINQYITDGHFRTLYDWSKGYIRFKNFYTTIPPLKAVVDPDTLDFISADILKTAHKEARARYDTGDHLYIKWDDGTLGKNGPGCYAFYKQVDYSSFPAEVTFTPIKKLTSKTGMYILGIGSGGSGGSARYEWQWFTDYFSGGGGGGSGATVYLYIDFKKYWQKMEKTYKGEKAEEYQRAICFETRNRWIDDHVFSGNSDDKTLWNGKIGDQTSPGTCATIYLNSDRTYGSSAFYIRPYCGEGGAAATSAIDTSKYGSGGKGGEAILYRGNGKLEINTSGGRQWLKDNDGNHYSFFPDDYGIKILNCVDGAAGGDGAPNTLTNYSGTMYSHCVRSTSFDNDVFARGMFYTDDPILADTFVGSITSLNPDTRKVTQNTSYILSGNQSSKFSGYTGRNDTGGGGGGGANAFSSFTYTDEDNSRYVNYFGFGYGGFGGVDQYRNNNTAHSRVKRGGMGGNGGWVFIVDDGETINPDDAVIQNIGDFFKRTKSS